MLGISRCNQEKGTHKKDFEFIQRNLMPKKFCSKQAKANREEKEIMLCFPLSASDSKLSPS